MSVLVLGGGGYIGSSLVPVLIEHGYRVDVVDLLWFGRNLPACVTVKRMDVLQLSDSDLRGYDAVIFLAGLSNDPMAEHDPAGNFVYNEACPTYLAYVAKRAGVKRFIYASSCSIYGNTKGRVCDENSEPGCTFAYGISKLQGERGVMQMRGGDFSVICLRQGTLSGHSPRMRFDLIVNTMFKCAKTEKRIRVNNPAIWRPILDIHDAIEAYLLALQVDRSLSGIFNIASGNYTVGQVGESVKQKIVTRSGGPVSVETAFVQDVRDYRVSCQKAGKDLGFRPTGTVEDIVDELCSRRNEYGDFNDNRYYNIRVFEQLHRNRFQCMKGPTEGT